MFPIFVLHTPANETNMRVSKLAPLLRVVFCSILSVIAACYSIGGFYSIPEPTGDFYHQKGHSPLSYHSNHAHFPFAFYSTLLTECAEEEIDEEEEVDDDVQEDNIHVAPINAPFVALVSYRTLSKQVALPRLRQAVLNRKAVFLFILYHSWKSFLG